MTRARKPVAAARKPRQERIMVSDVTAIAERFWTDLEALAARATPDHRASVIALGLAHLGRQMGDRAQIFMQAAAGAEEAHRSIGDSRRPA
jgi:hypothetical protein